MSYAQITIVNYDFNNTSSTSYLTLTPVTVFGVNTSIVSSETFAQQAGVASGGLAFTSNSTAGNALTMTNSSGNTRYFEFQLSGADLSNYSSYKIYLQARRTTTGAQTVTLSYSTNGTNFTNFNSMSPPDGSFGESIFDLSSITSINSSSALYFKLIASGASGAGTLRIDNFQIQAIPSSCTLPSAPTSNASNINFTNVGCGQFDVSWTNGNGTNRIVVVKSTSAITSLPSDRSIYTANNVFGLGSTIGTGEYVAYNGNGSSFTLNGLSSGVEYFVSVFEYNSGSSCPNYLSSGSILAGNQTTLSCQEPYLTGALINACPGTCTEGQNELLFFNSGSYTIPVSTTNVIVKYGSSSPANTTFTDAFTTNSAFIDQLNLNANCGTLFIDGLASTSIPLNTPFIIVRSDVCYGYDFSSFCGEGPIYVLFSTDASWGTAGNFANSGTGSRYFQTDFTALTNGSVINYSYEPALLPNNGTGDGDELTFNPIGGAAISYYNNGSCNASVNVLPIELLDFNGGPQDQSINLTWSTLTEWNNDYFTIERSCDGLEFTSIGNLIGAGNSNSIRKYEFLDVKPVNGINYYRLRQMDFNGQFSYSNLIAVNFSLNGEFKYKSIYHSENTLNFLLSANGVVNYKIFDSLGKEIKYGIISSMSSAYQIPVSLTNGIYFLKISNSVNQAISKFIVQ